jgi:hypothetical protein
VVAVAGALAALTVGCAVDATPSEHTSQTENKMVNNCYQGWDNTGTGAWHGQLDGVTCLGGDANVCAFEWSVQNAFRANGVAVPTGLSYVTQGDGRTYFATPLYSLTTAQANGIGASVQPSINAYAGGTVLAQMSCACFELLFGGSCVPTNSFITWDPKCPGCTVM